MTFDEILTGTIGFILAMVIISMVLGGGLYGYYVYVHRQVLENYLWPVADVVPYNGGYYLGVVNTGHEPFIVKKILLANGGVINVNSNVLNQNQWWFYQTNQLPVAVFVCSAIDPSTCTTVNVNGWIDDYTGVGNAITVVVNDPYNATWVITWNYLNFTRLGNWFIVTGPLFQYYIVSGSSSSVFYINPPYTPIQINMRASLAGDPVNYTCWIKPYYVSNTFNIGSTIKFNVNCTQVNEVCYTFPVLFGNSPPLPPICLPPSPP
ncbi:hypothetical protein [Vulcanisaeta distributa]|uniref:Uncharacterized protein n=1 Tax=Vulcanisaeta distributa (strain DSM 14429 / JCM 11212 / NBRC 100878 / IC-017) TaxID=572478 RepID=E1QQE2_VULDI|nr:hypothetical protein [Vulcanisaeta distributa]ADN51629.1 hypothetical protein Vdis_2261 [Vulcanisaeta distributa DSM 14429]